jgi:cysteinyl-tRNA synthetase
MALTLYNTLTRREDPFTPLEPGQVRIYCCGVTVYDYCHVGHARSYVVWDVVRRYLQWCGYQVRYIQNFTDIDDKILNRAREQGSSMEAVAERFTQTYFEDMHRLNVRDADEYPRATHTLDGIQRLIHELEHRGFAYPADGDVYYRVRKFAEYGKLSHRKLEDMEAGRSGRTDDPEEQKKEDLFDFALWKAAKPGEPFWESPWGKGRPGWHIECSAMVRDRLGETIDIHCGGADLTFPHHENEIAQSEAATGKALANYWLHNGMVTVNGEKMSKSLGNFTTIRDLLDGQWSMYPHRVDPMAVRLFILQAQYRKPLDFTPEAIAGAQQAWMTLKEGLQFGMKYGDRLGWQMDRTLAPLPDAIQQFQVAMDSNLNTPAGLAVVFELAKKLQREGNVLVHQGQTDADPTLLQQQWQTLVPLAQVLGLDATSEASSDTEIGGELTDGEIEALIAQRKAARAAKDFALGDRIRDELNSQGITLIDQPGGVTNWVRS